MGLDMYLTARRRISRFEEEDRNIKVIPEGVIPKGYSLKSIGISVAYWRKANQIHNWFVENVQAGEDNCEEYYVDRGLLEVLIEKCKEVLKTHDFELLPTGEGFFFGSTDYGEDYLSDLEETVSQLEKALKDIPDSYNFYYQSSW